MEMNPDFFSLTPYHLLFQKGCYFADYVEGPDCWYAWSDLIPDVSWNMALARSVSALPPTDWLISNARRHDRKPAICIPEKTPEMLYENDPKLLERAKERWMALNQSGWEPPVRQKDLKIHTYDTASPPGDFLLIFGNLFSDDSINQHFHRYYLPALSRATTLPRVKVRHFVGAIDARPVCCASVYLCDGVAGLYNVGTLISEQKQKFGRTISAAAIAGAFDLGAQHIFLQCEVGTHVERLYSTLGFQTIDLPSVLTFADA
jgi:hypothetical protein